ncbi:MAG: hypothetical protein OEZ22_07425 [Spirochaetia bacterium]|nr:hypothetical protein [Spirochaetia bacterium]
MKCRKQPLWAKAKINNVWEVRIDLLTWEKIIYTAKKRKKTYSWIVRYCVFSLLKVKNLRWTKRMQNLNQELKYNLKEKKHRHMLCLYGQDEILLRNSALILGVSVSKMIRLAIAVYIDRVLNGMTSNSNLFWQGIKIYSKIKYFRSMRENYIAMVFHNYKKFLIEEYWGFS